MGLFEDGGEIGGWEGRLGESRGGKKSWLVCCVFCHIYFVVLAFLVQAIDQGHVKSKQARGPWVREWIHFQSNTLEERK